MDELEVNMEQLVRNEVRVTTDSPNTRKRYSPFHLNSPFISDLTFIFLLLIYTFLQNSLMIKTVIGIIGTYTLLKI